MSAPMLAEVAAAETARPGASRRSLYGKIEHAVYWLARSVRDEGTLPADSTVLPIARRTRQNDEGALLRFRLTEAKRMARYCRSLKGSCPGCAACMVGAAVRHQAATAALGRVWDCGCEACVRMRGFAMQAAKEQP